MLVFAVAVFSLFGGGVVGAVMALLHMVRQGR